MALTYRFRCSCGREFEFDHKCTLCPACKAECFERGMVQRDTPPPQVFDTSNLLIGQNIESPPEHDKWFKSSETQEEIRKGNYQVAEKGSDAWNRRLTKRYG